MKLIRIAVLFADVIMCRSLQKANMQTLLQISLVLEGTEAPSGGNSAGNSASMLQILHFLEEICSSMFFLMIDLQEAAAELREI